MGAGPWLAPDLTVEPGVGMRDRVLDVPGGRVAENELTAYLEWS